MLIAVQPFDSAFQADAGRKLNAAAVRGADAIELRLDLAPGAPLNGWEHALRSAISASKLPVIATVRRGQDGGKWTGTEGARGELLELAARCGAGYVDVEMDVGIDVAIPGSCLVIRSLHLAGETPPATVLQRGLGDAVKSDTAFLKVVLPAKSLADNLAARELIRACDGLPLAVFCSGPSGIPSRVLGPLWGSALGYCAAPGHEAVAPGMLTLDEMVRVYRWHHWKRLSPTRRANTLLYGVVGSTASHSKSPVIHNGIFAASGKDALYLPLQAASLGDALAFAEAVNMRGLSVTVPFKAEAASLGGDAASASVYMTDAANTLTRTASGWSADNTDSTGFFASIAHHVDAGSLAQARVLILGYGGSARAVLHALKGKTGELVIAGRNAAKARALAAAQGVTFHPHPESDERPFDMVVNCTPVGMTGGPAPGQSPVDLATVALGDRAFVIDLVYNPAETPFLAAAKGRGARRVNGYAMLAHQAIEQQHVWGNDLVISTPSTITTLLATAASSREHAPPLKLALVGYRAAGKTTVGKLLAEKLGVSFIDLDNEIEDMCGQKLHAIFFTGGEDLFRIFERKALEAVIARPAPCVLATGGGTVETIECCRLLREGFQVVWLDTDEATLIARLEAARGARPAIAPGDAAEQLRTRLPGRREQYRAIADRIVQPGAMTAAQVADEILKA